MTQLLTKLVFSIAITSASIVQKSNMQQNLVYVDTSNLPNELDNILDSNDIKPKLLMTISLLKLLEIIFVEDEKSLMNNKNTKAIFKS